MVQKGRPRKVLDLGMVEKLAAIQCSEGEMAAVLEIDISTVQRRKSVDPEFKSAFDRGRATGRVSLRRLQWKAAERGNAAVLIFLGKNYLGQRDHFEDTEAAGEVALRIHAKLRAIEQAVEPPTEGAANGHANGHGGEMS